MERQATRPRHEQLYHVAADLAASSRSAAREREVRADRLGGACAIVLVELTPETPLYAFGGGLIDCRTPRGAFERNSNDWQPLEHMG